jgi:asparagine N-glycosylation enzyme membrane subunit Stt3
MQMLSINIQVLVKRYWPVIAVLAIVLLGTYVRTYDYKYPYLRNIDSYAFTRQIEDIVSTGSIPSHDNLTLAPYGQDRQIARDLYVYIMAYSYGFVRFFVPNYTLFQFLIWAPALLAALMAVPMYFIGKLLYDRRAGILAAFFIVFDISILSRTLGADPDNDGSVLLFPLIAIALFLFAYQHISAKGLNKKGVLYTIFAGIALGVWGYVWSGFWFVIWLLTGFVVAELILAAIRAKGLQGIKQHKNHIIMFVAVIAIFFIMTIPVFGINSVVETVQGPFSFGDIKGEENRDFPNVYVSVAELQSGGTLKDIIQRTNVFLFTFMIFSLVYLAFSVITKRKEHIDTLLLLTIWFIGPLIASGIGIRFSILFAAPIAIGSAIFISKVFRVIDGEGVRD